MSSSDPQVPPWYKQFWPWFLIALLLSSVTFSMVYLALSIRYFDGSVPDDYYKEGLAINVQLEKQQRAEALGLAADLRIDATTGDVVVQLLGDERPERLQLELKFPTDGDRDRLLTLSHTRNGQYVGTLERNLRYRWYLQLQPWIDDGSGDDAAWRLTGEAEFPRDGTIHLTPGL
ncbi:MULTISPECIES: FixH family protein [unclassified Halomonas]|uniref:FixH family protein n=1 Tax=unclassified Halomonas TaxID=2609666 RepID=UPI001C98044A|nr:MULTISPECIES: FixH family protein [unclassified Halomonas]MBY5924640.1 FixH family protein [Halomonas sp. DP4Y7-2]MBY6231682.1 FixH family protein [Halomonas sp. DP4Y7-1]